MSNQRTNIILFTIILFIFIINILYRHKISLGLFANNQAIPRLDKPVPNIHGWENLSAVEKILAIQKSALLTEKALGYKHTQFDHDIRPQDIKELFLVGHHIPDLEFLKDIPNISRLHLAYSDLKDITEVCVLRKLKELDISYTQVKDISPVQKLPSLKYLNISGLQLQNIESLSSLHFLESLIICRTSLLDISPLAHLNNLHFLYIEGPVAKDFTPLATNVNLQCLSLHSNPYIHDLLFLSDMKQLLSLEISDCHELTNISGVLNVPNLKRLEINNCSGIDYLPPMKSEKYLESLVLSDLPNLNDISNLREMPSLKNLRLSYIPVSDISVIGTLSLDELLLNTPQVHDYNIINGLKKLKSLQLLSARLDLSYLNGLSNLMYLEIVTSPSEKLVLDSDVVSTLRSLVSLNLYKTQIVDLSPLKNLPNLRFVYVSPNTNGYDLKKWQNKSVSYHEIIGSIVHTKNFIRSQK